MQNYAHVIWSGCNHTNVKIEAFVTFPKMANGYFLDWSVFSITLTHIFRHNINRFLGHDSIKLDELLVPQLLHDLGFLEKGFWRHCTRLQRLDCYTGCTIPSAFRVRKKKHNQETTPIIPLHLICIIIKNKSLGANLPEQSLKVSNCHSSNGIPGVEAENWTKTQVMMLQYKCFLMF